MKFRKMTEEEVWMMIIGYLMGLIASLAGKYL
ncbi:MAG: hypothetical protein BWY31_04372 [Lentisphaerae bacterium ADurb.Bin242]|nr:MAG: hypothetical protein BWY31_04372 [Lentisphaerae bacterium ADurb.Bin242]